MSRAKNKRKSVKAHVTRHGKLVGGYMPNPVAAAINEWIQKEPERDISTFLRQAAREKLQRDGIAFNERSEAA